MGPDCVKCRIAVPYDGLAAALTARGFHAGTIIAADRQDAGNLRRIRLERPRYVPPLRADAVPTVAVVWREGAANRLSKAEKRELAAILGGLTATPERVRVPWRPYPPTSAERVWKWMVVVADSPPPK